MKYKAVIFDLDGTLIDSMGVWLEVDKEYLHKRNIAVPDDLFEDVEGGNSFTEICHYFKAKFNIEETIEEIGAEWISMVADHYQNEVKLRPAAEKFLKILKENDIKLGVGTSNSKYLAETVLQANNVYNMFDSIVAGCDGVKGKPFPDIFLQVAKELAVEPSECLVIEDVLVGVQAAKSGNMDVFAIYDQHAKKEKTRIEQEADFYANNFDEIIAKLGI